MVIFSEVLLPYEMKLLAPLIEQLTEPEYFEDCVHSRATKVKFFFIKHGVLLFYFSSA
jgi:hypothetical protein